MVNQVGLPTGRPAQRNVPFIASVLCIVVAASLMIAAVYHGQWLWALLCGLAFAVFVFAAFCAAASKIPRVGV